MAKKSKELKLDMDAINNNSGVIAYYEGRCKEMKKLILIML